MLVIGCSWSWIVDLAKITQGSTIKIFLFFFFSFLVGGVPVDQICTCPANVFTGPTANKIDFSSILKSVSEKSNKKNLYFYN